MKKISLTVLSFILLVAFSCKQAKKESEKDDHEMEATQKGPMYSIVDDSTKVHFTAYKTTDKLPVGGDFLKADLTYDSAGTPKEVIDGLEFSIPVSSLFTNDATKTRDPKILEFFFGVMTDTELIKGKFMVKDEQNCVASLTMNGVTVDLPMSYSMEGEKVNFSGTMDLNKWNAIKALTSLNKACKELHTGPDGVSKTWDDVAINASLLLEKK